MDRIGAGLGGYFEQAVDAQVRLCRGGGSEPVRAGRVAHMQRLSIGVGIHGHRLDTEVATGADNPNRDLAAVGHQNAFDLSHPRKVPRGTAAAKHRAR
jgi:hypothetical protein